MHNASSTRRQIVTHSHSKQLHLTDSALRSESASEPSRYTATVAGSERDVMSIK